MKRQGRRLGTHHRTMGNLFSIERQAGEQSLNRPDLVDG
jgi:hypothetical protein